MIEAIAQRARDVLNLTQPELGAEFYYQSLPLCVIDAVFSIGVRYASVQNTVKRFCAYAEIQEFRDAEKIKHGNFPSETEQFLISDLLTLSQKSSFEEMATIVYQNKQRTSSRNGILKAEAVQHFAQVLSDHKIHSFQDLQAYTVRETLAHEIKRIRGQGTGISFDYFMMLAGNENGVKPDRMILRFIKEATGEEVNLTDAQQLIIKAAELLTQDFQRLTPRKLDYMIWQYQSLGPR